MEEQAGKNIQESQALDDPSAQPGGWSHWQVDGRMNGLADRKTGMQADKQGPIFYPK